MKCPICSKEPDFSDPDVLYPNGLVWERSSFFGKKSYYSYRLRPDLYEKGNKVYTFRCKHCLFTQDGDSKKEATNF